MPSISIILQYFKKECDSIGFPGNQKQVHILTIPFMELWEISCYTVLVQNNTFYVRWQSFYKSTS